ncbi:hypothetical protein HEFE104084_04885 [Helicobacter felis]|uniref:Uncharacterized protein n=1 Tax=Helicobacter felis (strain ATCC 49179 / CCUG 28539 / NCTC 12436 / CS1) TaxID=936155 RepID=E7A8R4_HELFC|nr:putative uncharacterized protein [Helicobacter felis ATCC 49179]
MPSNLRSILLKNIGTLHKADLEIGKMKMKA